MNDMVCTDVCIHDVFCDDLDYYEFGYIISLVVDVWDLYLRTCDFIELWPQGKPPLLLHHPL